MRDFLFRNIFSKWLNAVKTDLFTLASFLYGLYGYWKLIGVSLHWTQQLTIIPDLCYYTFWFSYHEWERNGGFHPNFKIVIMLLLALLSARNSINLRNLNIEYVTPIIPSNNTTDSIVWWSTVLLTELKNKSFHYVNHSNCSS